MGQVGDEDGRGVTDARFLTWAAEEMVVPLLSSNYCKCSHSRLGRNNGESRFLVWVSSGQALLPWARTPGRPGLGRCQIKVLA